MYNFYSRVVRHRRISKMLLVMKITTLIMILAIMQVSAVTRAQKITLSVKNAPISAVFQQIRSQTGYDFAYTTKTLEGTKAVTVNAKDEELKNVLDRIFEGQPIDYSIEDKLVVVSIKEQINVAPVVEKSKAKAVQIIIQGKVVDEKGQSLPGVTIRMQGSNGVWITNKDGLFALVVPDGKTILQFSFIGFEPKEIAIANNKSPITVIMKESVGSLDEVQVLAYGTTTKRYGTGNVVTIGAKEIVKNPVPNVLQAIQNQVPGLFIQQSTGNISGGFTAQIRSGGSFVGNNPLFIVDGVQYPAGQRLSFLTSIGGPGGTPNQFGNALNYLSPNDIESISVLKDADATSLYGSRGAYGVIIITTKKGKPGAAHLDVNAFSGVSVVGNLPRLLNTDQYLEIRREALANAGTAPGATDLDLNGTWPTDRYTDWRKYYLSNHAQNQNVYATYSGGSNNTNFLISGNLRNQRQVQRGKGGEIDGGIRLDVNNTSQNKKFYIDLSATYNLSRNNTVPYDYVVNLANAPNAPLPILSDGSLDWSTGRNAAAAANALYLNTNNNLLANLIVKYNFTKDLAFNTQIGYSLITNKEFRALPSTYFVPSPTAYTQASSTISTFNIRALNIDPNIAYVHKFFDKLSLDSRIGFTAQDRNNYTFRTTGTNFSLDELLSSPTSASGTVTASYINTPDRYIGGFAYARLNWGNKYMLSLNGRRDGTTAFGPDRRFGNFGSVAGAWIISEEPWMKAVDQVINFAKLRASYGTSGGDQIGSFQYLNTFGIGVPYAGTIPLSPTRIANPDLHWESKRSEELGLTLQFLNGRIELDGSYYRNWVNDPLFSRPLSTVTGFTAVTTNIPEAKLLNWGYEATLNTVNIKTTNFKWTTSFNITIPKSKLISFPGLVDGNSVNPVFPNYRLGKPINGIMLFNYAGVNPQTGNYSFINAQGVQKDFTVLDLNLVTDRTVFLNRDPKYYGGLGNTFAYKTLSVGFFFTFTSRMGQTIESYQTAPAGLFNVNPSVNVLRHWRKPGDITDQPRVAQDIQSIYSKGVFNLSTGAYNSATYARLNNVNINYDFTGKWLAKAGIRRLGVYLQGQNLLTISKYKDLDPENLNPYSIGPLRVFVAGFNITL
jgi:TonB-linked SusC/RagA family outer membrane protein